LILAAALARLIAGMLYEVRPTDGVSFGACLVLVIAVAALASYIPARRATRVDPASSLRGE
jgi:putative ABC transport system permease protein